MAFSDHRTMHHQLRISELIEANNYLPIRYGQNIALEEVDVLDPNFTTRDTNGNEGHADGISIIQYHHEKNTRGTLFGS